jgi:hypothetical protein
MISHIDPLRSAILSIASAAIGSTYNVVPELCTTVVQPSSTTFQWIAWLVAILAGSISAWNGFMNARERYRRNHKK